MIPLPLIREHAASRPEADALIGPVNTLTWLGFADKVADLLNGLQRQLDGTPDPRVVIFGPNTIEYVCVSAALATLGIPHLGLDASGPEPTVSHQLAQIAPTVIIAIDHAALPPTVIRTVHVADLAGAPAPTQSWTRPAFCAYGFTSGTTGMPKLVIRREPSEARRNELIRTEFHFGPTDVHLVTVPFFHASGHGWARTFLTYGASVVIEPNPTPSTLVELVERHAVSTTLMVPPTLSAFLDAAENSQANLTSLRFLLTGGRHIPSSTIRRVDRRIGDCLHTYYGTTETGVNLFATPSDLRTNPQSAGRPLDGNSVAVLRNNTAVPNGIVGRVALASFMAMSTYGDADAEWVDLDGVQHLVTADYGYVEPTGSLVLVNRHDGLDAPCAVPTMQLESLLHELSEVKDAVILRLAAHDRTRIVAAIVPATHTSAQQACTAASRVLSRARPDLAVEPIPVPAVPYGPTGKVQLSALRSLINA